VWVQIYPRTLLSRTCEDMLCVRVHELWQGRTHKTYDGLHHLTSSQTYLPFLSTKPSTTGVMLAIECPTSMTRAEPFPAANLEIELRECEKKDGSSVRVQDACIGYVKRGDLEFLEHDLGHSFSIGCCVPGGFGHENGMFGCVGTHDLRYCMRYQGGDGVEIEY